MCIRNDRIRHAFAFEKIGLLLIAPLASWTFSYEIYNIGVIAVTASVVATVWNYCYNILLDKALLELRNDVYKTVPIRVLHTVLFEGGLLLMFMPIIAGYLGITLWEAFVMNIAMPLFYLVYTFVYNIAYDTLFPIPE